MNRDHNAQMLNEIKAQFESLDRTTRDSMDRLRAVIHRNKKELEAPIYRNRLRLKKLGKRSLWGFGIVAIQLGLLIWLVFTHVELKRQVSELSRAAHDLEVNTVKQLQRVEGDVNHIKRARKDGQTR